MPSSALKILTPFDHTPIFPNGVAVVVPVFCTGLRVILNMKFRFDAVLGLLVQGPML
jgi:hypothetical protein